MFIMQPNTIDSVDIEERNGGLMPSFQVVKPHEQGKGEDENMNEGHDVLPPKKSITINRRITTGTTADARGPEELIRHETRAVVFLRAMVLVVLILVGGLLSFGTYRFISNSQENDCDKGFDAVSTRLIQSFHTVLSQSTWNAYSMGVAVTNANMVQSAAPNLIIPNFDQLTQGVIVALPISTVVWAPLIANEKEKESWEQYVQQQETASMTNTASSASSSPTCNVCGNNALAVDPSMANETVVLSSGNFTCGQLELAGQTGLIAPTACPSLAPDVIKSCHCQLHAKNQSEVPGHTILQLDPQRSVPVQGPGPYFPIWQISSVDTSSASQLAMRDLNSIQVYHKAIEAMVQTQRNVISETSTVNETESLMFSPVYSATPATTSGDGVSRSHMIGAIVFKIVWDMFLDNIVPLGSEGIDVILENSCGQTHTFRSMGDYVVHVGVGEFYDPALESYKKQTSYEDYLLWQGLSSPYGNTHESPFNCAYRITLYPSNEYRSIWINNKPRVYAIVILMIFVFTCVVFVTYDCCVARRQRKVMHAALQRDEIVTSLFPDAVRGRLLKRGDEERCQETQPNRWNRLLRMSSNPLTAYRHRQRSISSSTTDEDDSDIQAISPLPGTDSIADYFPCVTVVFADISGFTAWSSEHDPSQVFHLLETVYHTFDKLARRYGVFKIETIGDCYVAVAGLPLHQPDHAIRVVMFAYECIVHMQCMLRDLQATLGPSTSELSIRIGIHSGPVIAGVLRGEKSRFQLFGDTMNTTSRVQTTGEINKIQISVATAKLLEEAKKSYWIEPRADLVAMKGKGLAQTYWVDLEELAAEVEGFDYSAAKYTRHDGLERWRNEKPQFLPPHPPNFKTEEPHLSAKNIFEALIESNTDMLMVYLRKVIGVTSTNPATSNLYDEVHAIDVPNGATKAMMPDNDFLAAVRSQLRDYIATIVAAGQSDDFPYHNFEHASYVARSAVGLIEGMVNTKFDCMNDGGSRSSLVEQPQLSFSGMERMVLQRSIHHKTFGISSDPLMQFALVLFAVINNFPFHPSDFIDAVAVTSTDDGMATCQHFQPNDSDIPKPKAIDFAWSFLTNGQEYQKLWHCICGTKQEQQVRFRQLLHRAAEASTMSANDRMKRWDNAVRSPYTEQEGAITVPSDGINNDLREVDQDTMLVFESVVQAAQLAHYMQEWDTFQYWQMHWLEECLLRRLDPSAGSSEEQDLLIRGLHERERLFFEQYAIPLAKDLGSCGRGFVSLLRLAEENQRKWEVGGMEMVHSILIGKESD